MQIPENLIAYVGWIFVFTCDFQNHSGPNPAVPTALPEVLIMAYSRAILLIQCLLRAWQFEQIINVQGTLAQRSFRLGHNQYTQGGWTEVIMLQVVICHNSETQPCA